MVDLTKLALHTGYPAFKNNNVAEGFLTIAGTTSSGTNTQTFNVSLGFTPDIIDIMFNGVSHPSDPRPNAAWFRQGSISVATNNAGGGNPSRWFLFGRVSGQILTVSAVYVQTFGTSESLTPTNFFYKVVDYSVF